MNAWVLSLVNLRKEFDVALSVASISKVGEFCCYCLGSLCLFMAFICFPDATCNLVCGTKIMDELEVLLFRNLNMNCKTSFTFFFFFLLLFSSLPGIHPHNASKTFLYSSCVIIMPFIIMLNRNYFSAHFKKKKGISLLCFLFLILELLTIISQIR